MIVYAWDIFPWIYSTINAISPLSARQGFPLCLHSWIKMRADAPRLKSSQACAHIHLCIAYTLGFMSWGKCTCPSALGHMFSDWFAHGGASGALKDKCLPRALWPPSLWNQAKTSFRAKPQQTPATIVFHRRCDAKNALEKGTDTEVGAFVSSATSGWQPNTCGKKKRICFWWMVNLESLQAEVLLCFPSPLKHSVQSVQPSAIAVPLACVFCELFSPLSLLFLLELSILWTIQPVSTTHFP